MKKSELLKKIEAIEGDPDIHLWNGFAGDWMPIGEIMTAELSRQSKQTTLKFLQMEASQLGRECTHTIEDCPEHQWELTQHDEFNDEKKEVIIINAAPMGKNSSGRGGDLYY